MKKFLWGVALLGLGACSDPSYTTTEDLSASPASVTLYDKLISQEVIANRMKDPTSVQFRGVRTYNLSDGGRFICGEVNAKNSFGAYVGYRPYYIRLDSSRRVKDDRISDGVASYETKELISRCSQAQSGKLAWSTYHYVSPWNQ